mgnify:CR=1 FL=1
MDINATDINSFYQSKLGGIVKRTIRQKIMSYTRITDNNVICGYGYTSPYLSFIKKNYENSDITELRPDFLDTDLKENYSFKENIIHEYFIPLDPSTVDLVISSHILEFVQKPQSSIEEVWRILKPNGYFIAIIPRRSGLWPRYDNNPFGYGRSYSSGQFKNLIKNFFVLDKNKSFLHFPPWEHYLNYKMYKTIENIGDNFFPYMGGLMICVCKKIVYAKNMKKQKKIPIKNIVAT